MSRNLLFPLFQIIIYLVTRTTQTIYKPTTVFYSQLCTLGHVNPTPSVSIVCTTAAVQENIIRTGIAMAEFTKPVDDYFSFNASVSAAGTTTSSFTITIQMAMPTGGSRLSYFLLVIKSQTSVKMIDLIHWNWGRNTTVDTDQNLNRSISQFPDWTVQTIFTSGSGLVLRSLITSFHLTPRRTGGGSFSRDTDTQFILLAAIAGSTINITLDVFDETRVSFIRGIVLMYDAGTVTAEATAKNWGMLLKEVPFNDPTNYAFATDFSAYGPSYNGKCMMGYNKIFIEGFHNVNFNFANTSMGNYSIMNFNTDSPTKQYGIVFCFGNHSTDCAEGELWIDSLTGLCHFSNTCPLPVFTLWTHTNLCPICTQLICTNCTITNRSNCLTCGPHSTLSSGKCVCNSNYWPLMTVISTSTLGMWNNVANSQTQCKYNCTAQIAGCVFDKCTSGTFCIQCLTGFVLQIISVTQQNCAACPVAINNCKNCSSITVCTLCDTNYFIDGNQKCRKCSSQIPGCLTCDPWWPCLTCQDGWDLLQGGCQCDPIDSDLLFCQTCSDPNTCTACVSNMYFLDSTDDKCYPCSTFDANCAQCSVFQICTLCLTNQTSIQINTNGSELCVLCSSVIPNCVQCLVLTACTLCDTIYFITLSGDCQLCGIPVPGCLTCTPTPLGAACNTCDVGWKHKLFTCECDSNASGLGNCKTCANPTVCTQCVSDMFYIDSADLNCYPCTDFDQNCVTCNSLNNCSRCVTTYGILTNSDGTTLCVPCQNTLRNCTECMVVRACTNCDYGFGLNSVQSCSTCVSMFKGCVECETSQACLVCETDTFLVMGICRYCWQLFKCNRCVTDGLSLICVSCETGYFLTLDPVPRVMYCRICQQLTSYCTACDSSECFTCEYPYLLGEDKKCSVCATGYQYTNGFCTNIPGCQNIVIDSQGEQVCIACKQALHFVMDVKRNMCVCDVGFKEIFNSAVTFLPQCLPICGDGIVLLEYEACDDSNTLTNDGCSSKCQIEPDFDCGVNQPSVCLLHVNIGSIEFSHISRVLGQNQGTMVFRISPRHEGLTKMKWDQMIRFNFSSTVVDPTKLTFNYQPLTGELRVTVPYNQQLQATHLESFFTLDPQYIVSQPSSFFLTHPLRGTNAPLIFERQLQLATQKNINLITLILTVMLLLQFYIGSYTHKMIGLETIQLIQSIYFVRMVADSSETSLMSSINSIQYSAGGYHNAEWFYGDTTDVELSLQANTGDDFLMIDLKRNFLLNANVSLLPVAIGICVFIVSLGRKYSARNKYLETRDQQLKDQYTRLRRSSQWAYDHLVFPLIMMFSQISYFQSILQLSSPSNTTNQYAHIQKASFAVHMILTLSTITIYCYELFESFSAYSRYTMTQEERQKVPRSMVEKLQHDENNIDRSNYHPAYTFCYLLYYFFLSLCMVANVVMPQFHYALQLNLGLAIVYFLVIAFWKPYANAVDMHNHFLKFYHATFVLFLVFCYIFSRKESLEPNTYITIMYLVTVLIASVIALGFIRILIQIKFRKTLEQNSDLLGDLKGNLINPQNKSVKNKNSVRVTKEQVLIMNNEYIFENQLKEYEKRLMAPNSIINANLIKNLSVSNDLQKKDFLINKIRKDFHKRKQNILLETITKGGYTKQMMGINDRTQEIEQNLDIYKQEIMEDNLGDQMTQKSELVDALLDKRQGNDIKIKESTRVTQEDIKVRLRRQWALMDYE